jgi:Zn-finger nucleic acid-binding protein
MSERQGIEIDYCPQCRGVWLDRGELDKILERVQTESEPAARPEAPQAAAAPQQYSQPQQPRYDEPRYDERRRDDRRKGDDHRYDSRDDHRHDPRYDSRDNRGHNSQQGQPRKKKSPFDFLGEIFEG